MKTVTYTKITRKQAIARANKGLQVVACASNLNPYFNYGIFTSNIEAGGIDDSWIKRFKYYNCSKESGHGISFYSVTC